MDKELLDKINLAANIFSFGTVIEFKHENMEDDEIIIKFGETMYVMRLPREVK